MNFHNRNTKYVIRGFRAAVLYAGLILAWSAVCGQDVMAAGPGVGNGAASSNTGSGSYEYPGWNGSGNAYVSGPGGGFDSTYWGDWDDWYNDWYDDWYDGDDDDDPGYSYQPGWRYSPDGWWFQYPDGSWPANGWLYIRGSWYRFGQSGHLILGWHKEGDGSWYYLNPVDDGTLGAMRTGWQLVDGKAYYFSPKADGGQGKLLTNTTTPDGYQVGADGALVQ